MDKIVRNLVLCVLALLPAFGNAQGVSWNKKNDGFKLPKITVTKSGPYVGIQRGKYNLLEFGIEGQYKRVKLIKPITHSLHMGFNYNFFKNVLGYDAGYWVKFGRLNLTYGCNFAYRTDFDVSRVGIVPVLGYKFWQLHLQTGIHLLTRATPEFPTNVLFVSLRFVMINHRDVDISK